MPRRPDPQPQTEKHRKVRVLGDRKTEGPPEGEVHNDGAANAEFLACKALTTSAPSVAPARLLEERQESRRGLPFPHVRRELARILTFEIRRADSPRPGKSSGRTCSREQQGGETPRRTRPANEGDGVEL